MSKSMKIKWFKDDAWRLDGGGYVFNTDHIFNDRSFRVVDFFYRTSGRVEVKPSEFRYPWYSPAFDVVVRIREGEWAVFGYCKRLSRVGALYAPLSLYTLLGRLPPGYSVCSLSLYVARSDGVYGAHWSVDTLSDHVYVLLEVEKAAEAFREMGLDKEPLKRWIRMLPVPIGLADSLLMHVDSLYMKVEQTGAAP